MKIGKGSCNGTFGELVQGVLDERPFLVTLPIPALKSEAKFIPNLESPGLIGPAGKTKAVTACKKLLERYEIKCGGTLVIESNILVGKGMASSSADIVAAIRAVADSFDLQITEEIISEIAIGIEPTDGVMYQDVVAYDHINGRLIEKLGKMPDFTIVGLDFGDVVDTVQFNKIYKNYSIGDRKRFHEAYEMLRMGIKDQNFTLIYRASTISAQINQKILTKPYFAEFERLAKRFNGGVVIAHSGTVMGLLLSSGNPKIDDVFHEVSLRFSNQSFRLVNTTFVKT
ncbi:kinase [Bacillus sp. DNRA2]|uniref:GHMP family kinase ATP-binding protein n=1 Tax=Bacillus sp. DNRA2 TaxID=2723053 RepID=UPI00145DF8E4|nr:kinase [Bacillus sp. DNRA2]NMD69699.1 kinase [Bacillus sp. DNRA2]